MPGETQHGIECSQFEALLSEALDERLSGSRKESFEAHGRICSVCGPLLADALVGQQLLKSLEDVEPPVHLFHNILASTTGISSTRVLATSPERRVSGGRLRQWWDSFATPTAAFVRQPRFVMSFGMIFFSFSLALSAAGVKPADVAGISLKPSAVKRTYYTTQGRIVKFYENIRLVYEIESRVREFKKSTTPAEPGPAKPTQNRKNNSNTSGQPDNKQERNYSRDESPIILAARSERKEARSDESRAALETLSPQPPDVTVTTNRRFV